MLSFWPSKAFSNVDLPTLGRPIRAIAPQRNGSTAITARPFDGGSARRRAWPLPARRFAGCFRAPWSAPRAGESGTRPRNYGCEPPRGLPHRYNEAGRSFWTVEVLADASSDLFRQTSNPGWQAAVRTGAEWSLEPPKNLRRQRPHRSELRTHRPESRAARTRRSSARLRPVAGDRPA